MAGRLAEPVRSAARTISFSAANALGSGTITLGDSANTGLAAKLVVLSNYATPDMRRKCLELGADRVFDKSNEIDALILYCCRLADGGTGNSEYSPLS